MAMFTVTTNIDTAGDTGTANTGHNYGGGAGGTSYNAGTVLAAVSGQNSSTGQVTLTAEGPVVNAGSPNVTFTGGGAAVGVDPGLTVIDQTSSTLVGATVGSGGFLSGDRLNFVNQNGITGSYNTGTGVLTLSGRATPAQYQAALRSVTFSFAPSDADPTAGNTDTSRTLTYIVNDSTMSSTPVSSTVTVAHAPPSVTAGSAVTYTRGSGGSIATDPSGSVTAPDSSGQIASAIVSITAGRDAMDVLAFTARNGIFGTYITGTGVLILTGTATAAQYQAAINSVTFATGNAGASGTRTLRYVVNDGTANSAAATSTVVVAVPTPAISGTVAGQAVGDRGTVNPLSGASVTDAAGQTDSATIVLTNGGAATDADGTLSGTGLTKTGTGTYTLAAASPAALTGDLRALVFTPTARQVAPGGTVTTAFGLSVSDTGGGTASDQTTSVVATAANDAPTISGQQANEATTDQASIRPFASVSIGDPKASQTQTATVTLSPSGDGTLSQLGTGTLSADGLTYTVSGTATDVTTALDVLTFTPTVHQVAVGSSVQTTFALSDTDGTATASGNTVVTATAVAGTPTAAPQSDAAAFGTATAITLTGSDPDNPPLSLTYAVAAGPQHGTLTGTGPNLTYTPATGYNGTDSFTFTDSNGTNTSAPATVSLTVAPGTPSIGGSHASADAAEAAVTPFGTGAGGGPVTVTDPNTGATDALTITLSGGGGSLAGSGLTQVNADTYTLAAGTADQMSRQLQALQFTPTNTTLGSTATTTFTLTDMSSAGTSATDSGTVVTDASVPSTLAAPTLAAASDKGVSDSDDLTNDTAPVFTGVAQAGATVTLYDGGTNVIGSGTATSGGYNIPTSGLSQGQNSITATQTANGLTSAMSPATTVTLDTMTPTITAVADSGKGIDANGNGDLGPGKIVTLTVTTSEPVTVSGGTPTLTLNDGGTATYTGGSGTTQQTFSYTVAAGQNTAKLAVTQVNANGVTVTDAAGNLLNPSIMGAAVPSGTLIVDTTAPIASSVTDTVAQNAGPTPIGIAAPSDNLTPAGNLAIAAGALPTDGLVTLADGTPVVSGQALTAAQLTGLLFTPTGTAGQTSAFTYSVTDGAGNASQGAATLNVGAPNTPPAPDTISIDQQVSYDGSAFAITGAVSSATGVRSVEITAQVDGVATDLGAATVDANGNFSIKDLIGAHTQGFITATETDGAGATASAQAHYSLQGGLQVGAHAARQDRYTADGSAETAIDLFKADGSQKAKLSAGGQTFASSFFDAFNNGGQPSSTFVFDPGFGRDVVNLFRVDGTDHDTLSFKGSDFGTTHSAQLAAVLANSQDTSAGLLITDPTPSSPGVGGNDTLLLNGITKQQFAANQADIAFHA